MDCELLSWEASFNIEEGLCRGCVDTSILFYSYGVIVTTPNNLEVGILPRLASEGNIQLPK